MAPAYIAEMCVKRCFDSALYQLRSAVRGGLVVAPAKKAPLGRRGFKYTGPSLCDALQHDT